MTKKLTAVLSVVLVLVMCLSLAACGDKDKDGEKSGIAKGDTFKCGSKTITLTGISEGAGDEFSEAGSPKGQFVRLTFDTGKDQPEADSDAFKLNGSAGIDSVIFTSFDSEGVSGIEYVVLFDIDKDADLDNLELTIDK